MVQWSCTECSWLHWGCPGVGAPHSDSKSEHCGSVMWIQGMISDQHQQLDLHSKRVLHNQQKLSQPPLQQPRHAKHMACTEHSLSTHTRMACAMHQLCLATLQPQPSTQQLLYVTQ
jgi:hypothetical protein